MHLDFMLNQVACFHGSQILWFQMQWLFSSKQTNLSIEEEPGKGPVPRNVVIAVTNTLKSAFLVMRCTPYTTIQKPAPTKELRPAPTPAPELSQTSPDNLAAPPIQRRSSWRASKAPDRLEISCGSKTYAQAVTGTDLCSICWVQLYRIQLWHGPGQQQTPGRRAGPSLSDWSDTISNLIEAENKKMTADCCSHQYT